MKKIFISGMVTTAMVFGGYTTVFASPLPSNTTTTITKKNSNNKNG